MPGFVLHVGAVVTCSHAGVVSAVPSPPRVLVSGMSVLTALDQLTVAGCTVNPSPDLTARWANLSSRVLVGGQPALLQAPPAGPGNGTCAPTAMPPLVVSMQVRVSAT